MNHFIFQNLIPYCNTEFIFDDETTLSLPELEVAETIERDIANDYIEYSYCYAISKVYDINLVLPNLNKTIFLDNETNRKLLENKGYLDKYSMKEKAYKTSLKKLTGSDKLSVYGLKWNYNLD